MAMTASEARKNLFPLIEQVNNDRRPIEITSKRGDAVLMSRADYEALEETAYLLRSPANARRLLESLEQARSGEVAAPRTFVVRPVFTPHGWADYLHWQSVDKKMVKRINRLIEDTLRDPFAGIGKPEPLRHVLQGCWSRRIDAEHRLVYTVEGDDIVVLQARYHYEP